jgi:hypothetical protein
MPMFLKNGLSFRLKICPQLIFLPEEVLRRALSFAYDTNIEEK